MLRPRGAHNGVPAAGSLVATASLLAVALLLAACSPAEPDGYDQADRILALADQSDLAEPSAGVDEEVLGPVCVLETREDEYGMTFEVCVPTEEPQPEEAVALLAALEPVATRTATSDLLPPDRFDQLTALLQPSPQATVVGELAIALATMDTACATSPEAWAAALPTVTDKMTAAVPVVREAADYRESPEARELARSLVERVALQSGCDQAAPSEGPAGGIDESALIDAFSATTAALEPLYQALWGDGKSPFFYHPDEMAHRLWMRDAGQVDIAVAGTSQALLGIEPDLVEERVGLSVGSVAIPGAVAEVQQHWLPEVTDLLAPRIILWGIGPLDLVSACQPDGRAEEFHRLSVLKGDLLFPFAWADDVRPLDRLLGPPGAVAHDETPTALTMAKRFPNPFGDAFEFAQADPNEMEASLERFRRAFERGDFCADRQALMGEIIAKLEAGGARVIVVGMPLSPELAATYAGGNAALEALVDNAATTVFEPAGAEYLGMMTSIDAPGGGFWFDVVHPTRAGGVRLSAELSAALLAAGLS